MTIRQPNFLDTLLGLIPGYRGHAERDSRRAQDKRLRDHVAEQLDRSKRGLDGLIYLVTQKGEIEGLDEVDSLKRLVGTCADALRHASYGESGLMEDVAVKTPDLDKVYQADLGLSTQAEEICTSVAALTSDTFRASLPDIRKKAQDFQKAISQREDLLREVFH